MAQQYQRRNVVVSGRRLHEFLSRLKDRQAQVLCGEGGRFLEILFGAFQTKFLIVVFSLDNSSGY
jgi:hypothetical protein